MEITKAQYKTYLEWAPHFDVTPRSEDALIERLQRTGRRWSTFEGPLEAVVADALPKGLSWDQARLQQMVVARLVKLESQDKRVMLHAMHEVMRDVVTPARDGADPIEYTDAHFKEGVRMARDAIDSWCMTMVG
jgi:hypothetical protein